ncbi:hypothetical protein [Massilia sp. S19_KUP03_FR1]|uniref:hypothetical protein n=1 Tax=Massilia sp. S19_KUP03_FR1 TaxID=3025503 RepID=UPI002FCD90F6
MRASVALMLAPLPVCFGHGVQDAVTGIHAARHAKNVLNGLGLPLPYHACQSDHSLTGAMVGNFAQWFAAQLDAPVRPPQQSRKRHDANRYHHPPHV